jgi:outer membrane protein TolC
MQPAQPRLALAARAAGATALAALVALGSTSCTTPGPTLAEAVPDIEARVGAPLRADLPWDRASMAWDGATPLDARTALACALQNNRALRRALLEAEVRRARYQDSQLPPNPMLDIGAGVPLDGGATPILAKIDWLWRREALVGESDAALRAALFEAAARAVGTAIEVRTAYLDVASAEEVLALSEADGEVAARVLRATALAFEAGEGMAAQVNEARMNAAEAAVRVMDARQALLAAKTRLLEAIGRGDHDLDWSTRARTARAAVEECDLPPAPAPQDHEDFRALVRERRLDLRAASARLDGALQRVGLARASALPAVAFGAGYDRDMEGDRTVMMQAKVSIPIFNQGQFRVAAAQAELEMARLDADALWQRALLEARRAYGALATMEHHAAQIRDVTLEAFDSNKRLLAEGVAAGEAAPLRLWQSEHQENHIRIQLARAERDRALAALAFERALVGTRLPADGGAGMGGSGDAAMAVPSFGIASQEGMP